MGNGAMGEGEMVDIGSALRPLVDHPASAPPPVAEIAARARRRRVRRRSAAVAVAVATLAAIGTRASLDRSADTTTVDRPADSSAPSTTQSTAPSTVPSTTAPPTTRSAPTTAPTTAAPPTSVDTRPDTRSTPTATVPSGPLEPFAAIEAEAHDAERGVETAARPGGGFEIRGLGDGDYVSFHDVDFGTSLATRFEAHVASGAGPGVEGTIEVRLDDVASPPFATIAVTDTGSWSSFATLAADTPAIGGTHDIYVTFSSPNPGDFAAIDWFRFRR
jgi:hypothetical protein